MLNEITWQPLFDCVYLGSLAIWVGGLGFWLLGGRPLLRSLGSPDQFALLEQAITVRCCYWVLSCAAVALAALVYGALLTPSLRGPRVGLGALLIIVATLILFSVVNRLAPRIMKAEATGSGAGSRGWGRQFWLLTVVWLIGLGLLLSYSQRPQAGPQLRESSGPEVTL